MINNRKSGDGKHLKFIFNNQEVAISDKEIPYFVKGGASLTFAESDNFYKSMFQNVEYVISIIEQGA